VKQNFKKINVTHHYDQEDLVPKGDFKFEEVDWDELYQSNLADAEEDEEVLKKGQKEDVEITEEEQEEIDNQVKLLEEEAKKIEKEEKVIYGERLFKPTAAKKKEAEEEAEGEEEALEEEEEAVEEEEEGDEEVKDTEAEEKRMGRLGIRKNGKR